MYSSVAWVTTSTEPFFASTRLVVCTIMEEKSSTFKTAPRTQHTENKQDSWQV